MNISTFCSFANTYSRKVFTFHKKDILLYLLTQWQNALILLNSGVSDTGKLVQMQGFGALLFLWGMLDFIMSQSGVDVYYDWLGIWLPDLIYDYSHWMAMALGLTLVGAAQKNRPLYFKTLHQFNLIHNQSHHHLDLICAGQHLFGKQVPDPWL